MPNLAYKQPALQRNKPMDYAKPAGSKMKKEKQLLRKKKEQGYKDRKDESIAMRVKKEKN